MEGRMSREEIIRSASGTSSEHYSSAPSRSGYYPRSRGDYRGSYRSTGRRTGRSSSRRYSKSEIIPEGADLFIVQLLASGILLLAVMFVAVFHTEGTAAVAKKLDESFSKNTTLEDIKSGLLVAREKFSGSTDAVLEIFGGEIENEGDVPDELADVTDLPNQPASGTSQGNDDVSIDSETLKQIYDNTEDYSKN